MTLTEFSLAVFTYCTLTDASVTSWVRSQEHNRRVGGVPHSAHVVGLAVDVTYEVAYPIGLRREWSERLGLKLISEQDHDHLQPDTWQAG